MAAPTPVVRVAPVGVWVHDGFTRLGLITFGNQPGIALWDVSFTPAGVDMGEPIPQDHMWIPRWRVVRERQLIKLTPSVFKAKYDPAFKLLMEGMCGVNQTITERLYDGSSAAYFGIPTLFAFDEHVEGQPGLVTITIHPSNWDPAGKVYAGPVFASVSGS